MLEREIEKFLTKKIKQDDGLCYKFVSPGNAGVPDRLIITKLGEAIFVELKTEKGKTTALQETQIRRLREHKQNVYILYGKSDVLRFLEKIRTDEKAREDKKSDV